MYIRMWIDSQQLPYSLAWELEYNLIPPLHISFPKRYIHRSGSWCSHVHPSCVADCIGGPNLGGGGGKEEEGSS